MILNNLNISIICMELFIDTSPFFTFWGNPNAKFLIVPLVSLIIGSIIRKCSYKESESIRYFFYWGPTLASTSLLVVFFDFCSSFKYLNGDQQIGYTYNFVVAFIISVIWMILLPWWLKNYGWDYNRRPKRLNIICGLVIPDVIGVGVLILQLLLMSE